MRVKMVSLFCFFALLLALSAYAQEPVVPLPTEIETSTATVTEVPTETPSDNPVLTATYSVTLTSSPDISPSPTASATPTSEPENSPIPVIPSTPTPFDPTTPIEAPFTVRLYDSFDSGALAIWQIGAGWNLVPNASGQALYGMNSAEPIVVGYADLLNVSLRLSAQIEQGALRLSVRESEAGSYSATFNNFGDVMLYRGDDVVATTMIPNATPMQWRTFELSAINDSVRVWVNQIEILNFTDVVPLSAGSASFGNDRDGVNPSILLIDDAVLAWEAENSLIPTLEPQSASSFSAISRFQSTTDDYRSVLYMTAPAPGSSAVQLVRNDSSSQAFSASAVYPAWRLDANELAYATSTPSVCRFFLRPTFTSEANPTCNTTEKYIPRIRRSEWDPVVNPAGTRMAFLRVSPRGHRVDLVIRDLSDATGSTEINLTESRMDITVSLMPAWSPTGDKIAFIGGTDAGTDLRIYVVDVASTPTITALSPVGFGMPFWSETGNILGFMSLDGSVFAQYSFDTQTADVFNTTSDTLWGQAWTPGNQDETPYLYMTNFDLITGTFEIVAPNLANSPRGLAPKVDCPECGLVLHSVLTQGPWTVTDLHDIFVGVTNTGRALAFQFAGYERDTFRRVMLLGGLTSIIFEKLTTGGGTDCNTSFYPTISCGQLNNLSEYTVVHELGHGFTQRTGGTGVGPTFYGMIFNPPAPYSGVVRDAQQLPVFGIWKAYDENTLLYTDDWTRGVRGWGSPASTPSAEPCIFQQNAAFVDDWKVTQTQRDEEHDEAVADMFLNWVYSRITQGSGFKNQDWTGVPNCP